MSLLGSKKITIAIAVLYAVFLFIGLTLYRLPATTLIPYFVDKASKGRLLLKIERTSFSIPLGCVLEKASYVLSGGDHSAMGRLETLTLSANPLGMITGRLPVSFEARTLGQGGRFQGSAGIPLVGTSARFEARLTEVDLENLGLASFSGRDLKGKLSGEMKFEGNLEKPGTMLGEVRLLLKNGSVDTRLDLAGLKAVSFDSVRIPFTIKNGRLLLEKGEMEGSMLSGTLSGQITLNEKISESGLDLTARLRPGPLLVNNPLAGALLSRAKEAGKEIVVRIGGTLRQPTIGWS